MDAIAGRQPNQVVDNLFGCIDNQDWPGLSRCLHDGVVYERPGYEPLIGKPAVLEFYLRTRVISCGRHQIEKVLSDGDDIACWGSFSGLAKDGRELNVRFADVYHLTDGVISLRRTFFDSPAI